MKPIRVKARDGRRGWRFRVWNPATKRRTWRTFWFRELADAQKARDKFMEGFERRRIGLPDDSGWSLLYEDVISTFLKEAPLTSDARRGILKKLLERNELKLHVLSQLGHKAKLTADCVALAKKKGDAYVRRRVQQPLKQLTAWAASIDLLPYDPLSAWKLIPRSTAMSRRRALLPNEMRDLLAAATEYDDICGREFPYAIIFKTLLVTGNRPGAVFNSTIGDLTEDRLLLPPGQGKKRNGMATLPGEFVAELRQYIAKRKSQKGDQPLLVTAVGNKLDLPNISHEFRRTLILSAVRRNWHMAGPIAADADPMTVTELLYSGKQPGFDGPQPTCEKKKAARKRRVEVTKAVAEEIGPSIVKWLEGRDMYSLRATHVSWARRLVNPDAVKLQVGHAPQDIAERHYLDLVDARVSSKAVWDVLTGVRTLDDNPRENASKEPTNTIENEPPTPKKSSLVDYPVDYGEKIASKNAQKNKKSPSQTSTATEVEDDRPAWIRTRDQGIMSPLLSPLSYEPMLNCILSALRF